jgi:hypothetical protein
MKDFILYSTPACHLCEQAHAMVEQELRSLADCRCQEQDIADDDELFERYGVRIPVLLHPDSRELGWPFDAARLRAFLQS